MSNFIGPLTKDEALDAYLCAERVEELADDPKAGLGNFMNLIVCHSRCPLDFEKLLASDKFNFMHDLGGIEQHLNKDTGELEGHFLPRCAKPQPEEDE